MKIEEIIVENLKCGGCANSITTALQKIEGIHKVDVDVETSAICIEYDGRVKKEALTAKLAQLGYPENGTSNSVFQKAKSYVSCAIGRIKD